MLPWARQIYIFILRCASAPKTSFKPTDLRASYTTLFWSPDCAALVRWQDQRQWPPCPSSPRTQQPLPHPTPILFLRGQEVLGLLDSPVPALQSPLLGKIGSQEDHEAALQAARESITLLKNGHVPTKGEEEEESVKALPLDRSKGGKLLVVGPACDSLTLQSGGWTKHWQVWYAA